MSGSVILSTYLALSRVAGPLYRRVLKRRAAAGKEISERLPERFGTSPIPRPEGRLIWSHAASIGETQSLLGLIPALLSATPDLTILVTSTTVTSAELLKHDLPDRAIHQFSPIDTPQAVRRFLAHWKPDVAIWVESEIWPRMMVETKAQGIPMMLINARVSAKTVERYRWAHRTVNKLFSHFDEILAQDQATFDVLQSIGISEGAMQLTGSLKEELAPPLKQNSDLPSLQTALAGRPVWVAASTHPGEEETLLKAHGKLPENALLILVPRHPERGAELSALLKAGDWKFAQRSKNDVIDADTQVYLADTIGEMGLWYRLSGVSFVAGSLEEIGGHNPFEPILLGSAVIAGPHVGNFTEVYARLDQAQAYLPAQTPAEIAQAVQSLLESDVRQAQADRARACLAAQVSITPMVRDRILSHLPE